MGTALFELAIVALAVWLVWRLISQRLRLPGQPAERGREDDFGVPARLRPKPKRGAGAVALEEPEEDEPESASSGSAQPPRSWDQRDRWRENGQGDETAT